MLDDSDLGLIASFIDEAEELVGFPEEAATLVDAFIPKLSGGRRPIGLMSGFPKAQEKARTTELKRWDAENSRKYTVGGHDGITCEYANWSQTLLDEYAKYRSLSSASVLIDVTKCFEYVRHHQLHR
jgi:hypothetical protein